jgi:DNA-binding response OmpR family regulator
MDPKRILIVDDQADIRTLLEMVLNGQGYDVTTAKRAPEALNKLTMDELPDLIILDVQMPSVDGWDTLAAIRARYGPTGPPVVMCTVKSDPHDLIHGWQLGCDGYVFKPFEMPLIIDEISSVLARTPAERMRFRSEALAAAQQYLRSVS